MNSFLQELIEIEDQVEVLVGKTNQKNLKKESSDKDKFEVTQILEEMDDLPDLEERWEENRISTTMTERFFKFMEQLKLEKSGKRGYHEHDSFPIHPVAVKNHSKYFFQQELQSTFGLPEREESEKVGNTLLIRGQRNPRIKEMLRELQNSYKSSNFGKSEDIKNFLISVFGSDDGLDKYENIQQDLHDYQNTWNPENFIYIRTILNELKGQANKHRDSEFKYASEIKQMDEKKFSELFEVGQDEAPNFIPWVAKTQAYLRQKFPTGTVTVYRGVYGKLARNLLKAKREGQSIEIPHNGISSYSLSREIAKEAADAFEMGAKGPKVILTKKVPIEKIWLAFPAFSMEFNMQEVLVDGSVVTHFDLGEIEKI